MPKQFIEITIGLKEFELAISAFKNALEKAYRNIKAVPLDAWTTISQYLELVVVKRFIENRDSQTLKRSTVEWKRSHLGKLRQVLQGTKKPVRFVEPYGQLTGFFETIYKSGQAVNTEGLLIRRLSGTSVANGMFDWGVNLPAFWRGY